MSSYVTDRDHVVEDVNNMPNITVTDNIKPSDSGTSAWNTHFQSALTKNIVTPESVWPHLKASSRKLIQKEITATILTEISIIEEKNKKQKKK